LGPGVSGWAQECQVGPRRSARLGPGVSGRRLEGIPCDSGRIRMGSSGGSTRRDSWPEHFTESMLQLFGWHLRRRKGALSAGISRLPEVFQKLV